MAADTPILEARAQVLALALMVIPAVALADDAAAPTPTKSEVWGVHGQTTWVTQADAAFRAPYSGTNSLNPRADAKETWDATLYLGVAPWRGAEIWINPEIDQGFGLSNTLGAAGFPSGEAYKVGKAQPYFRLQRLFIRQTIDLGGDAQAVDPDLNQLGGTMTANRLVLTAGKIGAPDIFDINQYAHDPRRDFMNWSVIDTGTFDYAADAWGYTYGAAAEWYLGRWALRGGVFNLSDVPNSAVLGTNFHQFQADVEVEERHQAWGRPGKLEVTGFVSRGRMGRLQDAVSIARVTARPADIAAVRKYQSRPGVSVNLEQRLSDDLGAFVHGGVADGRMEAYEFTDIDRTLAAGLSLSGKRWSRPDDTLGVAAVVNGISRARAAFLDAGPGHPDRRRQAAPSRP